MKEVKNENILIITCRPKFDFIMDNNRITAPQVYVPIIIIKYKINECDVNLQSFFTSSLQLETLTLFESIVSYCTL